MIRSWLFFAELVMIATGVMHCFPYNLKYKNSLALQFQVNSIIIISTKQVKIAATTHPYLIQINQPQIAEILYLKISYKTF